jgi:tRNA-dihydrouridine synthase B
MINNFWEKLKKPILVLAPLAGFNNLIFRELCQKEGADVLYSEMASATALFYNQAEKNKTLELLEKSKKEKNYVVQLFGGDEKHFPKAVKLVSEKIKPSGIDINCGCPVSKVLKQKAGVDLMREPKRARKIIKAVIYNTNLPVSIKIRKEAYGIKALEFMKHLIDLDIKSVIVHGRSLKQGFSGPIDFSVIKEIKKIFPGQVIANGNIYDLKSANQTLKETKADGIALARGALNRPWLFTEIKNNQEIKRDKKTLFSYIILHAQAIEEKYGEKGIIDLRKHLCFYMQNIPRASYYREKLVKASNALEIKEILKI